jgi:thymidine kinase
MGVRIEIILGSMFSGKSTELIRRCSRYEAIGKNVSIINHSLDSRIQGENVATHSKHTHKAIKTTNLLNLDFLPIPDCIGIDEAQFFPDLFDFISYMERFNVVIIIAGLDGDFKRNNFGQIHQCIPLCDTVTKLSAMCCECKDGTPGIFTKKKDSSNNSVIDIGGNDKFVSVCRFHYFNE